MICSKCHLENPDSALFCGRCAAPLADGGARLPVSTETLKSIPTELNSGAVFAGRYQIIEELGTGGMGRVYKAYDLRIKEKLALKLIRPEIAADANTIARFGNELRLARRISHRNICRLHDLTEFEGTHFITMEYVSGENLKTIIRMTGTLAVGTVISIGRQIADGLAEAHHLGIIHRDLKPHNIMIDRSGHAKIMDFGIARSMGDKGITASGIIIGTPEYMSPEQVEGEGIDARSDIYALGIILYEMATGKVPFEGATPLSVAIKQKSTAPRNPQQLDPRLPDRLCSLIMRCLEKDKANRYQSADQVRDELASIESEIPTVERVVLEDKPFTSKQIHAARGMKKLLIPGLSFLGLIAVILALTGVRFPSKGPSQGADRPVPKAEIGKAAPDLGDRPKAEVPVERSSPAKTESVPSESKASAPLKQPIPKPKTTPPAAPPSQGGLDIATIPPGAEILYEGTPPGTLTPTRIEGPAGLLRFRLMKQGYLALDIRESVIAGRTLSRTYTLIPVPEQAYKVEITTKPEDGRIYLNNQPKGVTPYTSDLTAGSYALRIEKEGYRPFESELKVTKDMTWVFPLEPKGFGSLLISSNPPSDLWIDGGFQREVPPVLSVKLEEGTHVLKFVTKFTKKERVRTIQVVKDQQGVRIHEVIDPRPLPIPQE